ncbi:hypothetical protein BFP77_12260 [Maribacter sp. 4U21]|uniref:hypothetical protein n=1 Tax=Maribacter sp. 4U21 TaxID=1889779 RepID=UPI000C146BB5|nr:hypothetical protein [Maribacter sp. 4U21]PIB27424.1 hypothetical protein BFP77_12260 [Maribacter sp. 4U21]
MKFFSSAISYIFHPLLVPIGGTLIYFIITPKYSPLEVQGGNILPIFILTVIIPIVTYMILRNLHLVHSVFMPSIAERKYPVLIHILLLALILYKVISNHYTIELYFFFVGLIGAAAASLMLLFLKFKVSLHLMGLGSLLMYLIALSIHFEINVIIAISLFTLAVGVVASSRLYLKAHTKPELLVGLMIGLLSQLLTVKFWL